MAEQPPAEPAPEPEPKGPSQVRQLADSAAEKVQELAAKAAPVVVPAAEQAAVNLRVWISFLQNPQHRDCLVKYRARERREAGNWNVVLPQQCWECGSHEELKARKFRRELRCFENAIPIMVIGPVMALVMMLFSTFCLWGTWSMFMFVMGLAMLFAVGTVLLLMLKSWKEDVRVTVFTCPKHADELQPPDMALDQEQLHLFAYKQPLAAAAQEELKAERKGQGPGLHSATPGEGPKKRKKREPEPVDYERPVTPDLPPIGMEGAGTPPTGLPVEGPVSGKPATPTIQPRDDLPPIKMDDAPIKLEDSGPASTEFASGSGHLVIYDPDALGHRTDNTDWWLSADEQLQEINAGNMLLVALGAGGSFRATEVAACPTGQTVAAVLHAPGGSIVIGPGECLGNLPAGVIGQRTVVTKPAGYYQVTVRRSGRQLDIHFAKATAARNSLTAPPKLGP